MALFFLVSLSVYAYLIWSWRREFGQHHWLGRLRRRWARGAAFYSWNGVKLAVAGALVWAGLYLLKAPLPLQIGIGFVPVYIGTFSVLLVAPTIFTLCCFFRALEMAFSHGYASPEEEGMGLSPEAMMGSL